MKKSTSSDPQNQETRPGQQASRGHFSDLDESGVSEIAEHMNAILADVFAIYIKTKNFHWHMSGPHFRDFHEMLDDQSQQLFAMTDPVAERVRKLGAPTLHSIGEIARRQRTADSEVGQAEPLDMLAELCQDNKALTAALREARNVCEGHQDTASSSMIDDWIDEAERRAWFLFEISRQAEATRH